MEKKVRKIAITSKPGATYFLQVTWLEHFDKGFTVTICDGHSAWIGEVSHEDLSREAADMEMERSKYVDELKKALITVALPVEKYSFDLGEDAENSGVYCFTYEKRLKDVSFKLGSLKLKTVPDPAKIIQELIMYCLNCATELCSKNEHLQKENERLQCDWNDMHKQLEKFVNSKEELEQDLYTRFTCVLNEKKAKIRSLNEKLSQARQQTQVRSDNSSVPFDTVPVSDLKNEDYSGSTDEEGNSQIITKETDKAPVSRRRSLINSPDDSPDIAPSRKRRQRGLKSSYTELKDKISQPEERQKQRCKPGSSKTTGKNTSSEKLPLPTSKSTPDPDDLFSDI